MTPTSTIASTPVLKTYKRPVNFGDVVLKALVERMDPETRTVQTIIECSNPRHLMLPNMYAQVRMQVQNCNSIIVPKGAVLQGDKSRYVLRKVGDGCFVRTPVEVISVDEHSLRVVKGLKAGDEIVMQGGFYLVDFK